jgi:hypothetical protein
MIAVFLLRLDNVTGKGEGEVYYTEQNGVINCDFWQSPKLSDFQVIIANGKNEIVSVFKKYEHYNITKATVKLATNG